MLQHAPRVSHQRSIRSRLPYALRPQQTHPPSQLVHRQCAGSHECVLGGILKLPEVIEGMYPDVVAAGVERQRDEVVKDVEDDEGGVELAHIGYPPGVREAAQVQHVLAGGDNIHVSSLRGACDGNITTRTCVQSP